MVFLYPNSHPKLIFGLESFRSFSVLVQCSISSAKRSESESELFHISAALADLFLIDVELLTDLQISLKITQIGRRSVEICIFVDRKRSISFINELIFFNSISHF
jgi:hypothetical protein